MGHWRSRRNRASLPHRGTTVGLLLAAAYLGIASPSRAADPRTCGSPPTVQLWPSAWPGTADAAVNAYTFSPDMPDSSVPAPNYCVLDIPGRVDAGRCEYELSGADVWILLAIPSLPCDPLQSECTSERLKKALRLGGGSLLAGESHGTDPLLLADSILPWLRQSRAPALSDDLRRLATSLLALAAPAQSGAGPVTFWSKASLEQSRRLFVARTTGNCAGLRLSRVKHEEFPTFERAKSNATWVGVGNHADALDQSVASRTVRLDYLQTDGCPGYCTGFVLGPSLVLTAKHCVAPARSIDKTPDCARLPQECQSYLVNFDYRNGGPPPASRRVLSAYANKELDFALVELADKPPAQRTETARAADDESVSVALDLARNQALALFSHPRGAPLRRSGCIALERGESESFAIHTCETSEGSSGAMLWGNVGLRPMALHTTAINDCWSGERGEDDDMATRLMAGGMAPELAEAVVNRVSDLGLMREECVGLAARTTRIYTELCTGERKKEDACNLFIKAFVEQAPIGTL